MRQMEIRNDNLNDIIQNIVQDQILMTLLSSLIK